MEVVTETTLNDYFTGDVAKAIYAPKVLDMSLITSKEIDASHKKGYLMMEVFPQNTATKVFSISEYQKWEYQKPYLLDVLQNLISIAQDNIVMTDLKPDNTLYDTDTRKVSIIDLGGTVKVGNSSELQSFNKSSYYYQSTPNFASPELESTQETIDLIKAQIYTFGKTMESVTQNTDLEVQPKVKELISSLTQQDPSLRPSPQEVLTKLQSIGSDDYKEQVISNHYISKIKSTLQENKGSISINQDIEETQKELILLYLIKFVKENQTLSHLTEEEILNKFYEQH
jgi:serine/threonine protein kinase